MLFLEYAFKRSSSTLGRVDTYMFMFVYKTFPNVFKTNTIKLEERRSVLVVQNCQGKLITVTKEGSKKLISNIPKLLCRFVNA